MTKNAKADTKADTEAEAAPKPAAPEPKDAPAVQDTAPSPDLATVQLMSTYRVGYLPPAANTLSPGELQIEVAPPGGGVPRLWVGTVHASGFGGNSTLLTGVDPAATASDIVVDAIDNPSISTAVHITGTVTPGVAVEIAALQGLDTSFLTQVTTWSPWDATSGAFDLTWYLPPGDNYRVRVRMRSIPQAFADSNLFLVEDTQAA